MKSKVRKPRRSVLYVPGSSEKALNKLPSLDVDSIIYDLEDSVAPSAKAGARKIIIDIINSGVNADKEQVVRFNNFSTEDGKKDVLLLKECKPNAILLPKVNESKDILRYEAYLDNLDTEIWAMMETPLAIVNAYQIARSSYKLKCFVMGTNDLSQMLNLDGEHKRTGLQTSFEKCMMAAKAYQLSILDGVYNEFNDTKGFKSECEYSHGLGFDGKTLIHPSQIDLCNDIFTPSDAQLKRAEKIVKAYAEAKEKDPDTHVIVIDGGQVEELHVIQAEKILQAQKYIKPKKEVKKQIISKKNSGNYFEDFKIGQEIIHATPRTVTTGDSALYTALYGSRFAINSSDQFAQQLSLPSSPIDDFLVFNIAFGKTVPDISLNAIANLGYADCRFIQPVYPGDTISAVSHIIGLKENSNGETGNVYVNSIATNQKNEIVIDYNRWVMVRKKNHEKKTNENIIPALPKEVSKSELKTVVKNYSFDLKNFDFAASGSKLKFEDYDIGEKIDHIDGFTVEEAEHMMATKLYQNPAKVHFNQYNESNEGWFGKRIVYGGHIISLVRAISFNGLANLFKIVAINGGSHASPCFAGVTVFAWSEVLDKIDLSDSMGALRIRSNGIKDAPADKFQHKNEEGKYDPSVLLSLDYWALIPKK
jgi:2-methylfumaryl-CoA hydratase